MGLPGAVMSWTLLISTPRSRTCAPPTSRVFVLPGRSVSCLRQGEAYVGSLPPAIRMGRIAVRPEQVVVLDFETPVPDCGVVVRIGVAVSSAPWHRLVVLWGPGPPTLPTPR
jgi:hypothetical protein